MTVPENRSAGALLRDAYAALRANWMIAIPLVILGIIGGGGRGGRSYSGAAPLTPQQALALLPFFALLGLVAIVLIVVLFFVYVAVWMMTTHAALALARGAPVPSWGEAWNAIKPRMGQGASAAILWLLAVVVGFILLIVPGFIVLSALFPLMVVVVAESKGGADALRRAWDMTKGERMPLFLVLLAGIGIDIAASIVLGWIPLLGGVLSGIVSGFISAGFAVAATLWYHRKMETAMAPPAVTPY